MKRIRRITRRLADGITKALEAGPAVWLRRIGEALWEARHTIMATLLTELALSLFRAGARSAYATLRPKPRRHGKVIPFPVRA